MREKQRQNKFEISVPDWARGITWYQIMPERFRNGDPNNTPKAADQKYAWPHDCTSPLERHPWGSDWYRLQPYERRNDRDIWFNLQRRRYGGDLLGIIDQLDYLVDLGIDALYLNPVFQAPSHHKYDAAGYHHVDPAFGPNPDGDRVIISRETPHDPATWNWTSADEMLLQLIEEVHRRNMFIILDGVFNHVGIASWVYQDILKNQQDSAFRDWMAVESWAEDAGRQDGNAKPDGMKPFAHGQAKSPVNMVKPGFDDHDMSGFSEIAARIHQYYGKDSPFRPGFRVRTWEGFLELPEWREDRRGIVDGPRQYIFDITRRWMDPYGNGDTFNGVDGWRLDVAFCVKHPFWKAWRKHVRSINPDAYLVAEVIDTVKKTWPYVKGDEFDAVMNYNFQFACNEFFIWNRNRISASQFAQRLEELITAFPHPVPHVMQNLLDSHDTDRVASRIVNRELGGARRWWDYYRRSKADNPDYDTRKPTPEERQIQRLLVLMQFTCPGAPMIYYGDEAGMWGANDPCCRKPMVWNDILYDDEAILPNGAPRTTADPVAFDTGLYSYYRWLINLRRERPALKHGDFTVLLTDDAKGVFVFMRSCQSVCNETEKEILHMHETVEQEPSKQVPYMIMPVNPDPKNLKPEHPETGDYEPVNQEPDEVIVAIHNGDGNVEVEVPLPPALAAKQSRPSFVAEAKDADRANYPEHPTDTDHSEPPDHSEHAVFADHADHPGFVDLMHVGEDAPSSRKGKQTTGAASGRIRLLLGPFSGRILGRSRNQRLRESVRSV
ncbi:MAG: glycoside hydrolase family 13 protein [Bacteroidota bacterium]